jgi:hypothetical protein
MTLDRQSEFALAARDSRPLEHRDSLPGKTEASPFWRAMVLLIEPPYTRDKLVNFFEHRAQYAAIRNWRYGHRIPPDWASEMIRHELEQRATALKSAARSLAKRGPGPAIRGTAQLHAWRARQAEEREKTGRIPPENRAFR